jgi:hypothetical protein
MAEPKISTVAGLKAYILRQLGSPVVNVELTDDQLQDSIDNTLDDYIPNAYSGVVERFVPIKLIEGTHQYILPYDVFAVLGVHSVEMG